MPSFQVGQKINNSNPPLKNLNKNNQMSNSNNIEIVFKDAKNNVNQLKLINQINNKSEKPIALNENETAYFSDERERKDLRSNKYRNLVSSVVIRPKNQIGKGILRISSF